VRQLSTPPPSGAQYELRNGEQRAVVVEVGGGLRSYEVGGRRILDGYGSDEICGGGRGQPLLPWPNRIYDGRYEWQGKSLQLDISEFAAGNAIHGLTRWRNWTGVMHDPRRVSLTHALHPSPGYPFSLDLEISYELVADGLVVQTRARNRSTEACPYGIGFHPYLSPPRAEVVDDCFLELPASVRLITDQRGIPYSSEPVDGTPYDFRAPRELGNLVLDTCFTNLARGADGNAVVAIVGPGRGGVTRLWFDGAYPYVMVYSGDTLPQRQRRRGLAVEPMSCAPNAFASGAGLVALEPGEEHLARWGISPA